MTRIRSSVISCFLRPNEYRSLDVRDEGIPRKFQQEALSLAKKYDEVGKGEAR